MDGIVALSAGRETICPNQFFATVDAVLEGGGATVV
jgi:hypothetical protein